MTLCSSLLLNAFYVYTNKSKWFYEIYEKRARYNVFAWFLIDFTSVQFCATKWEGTETLVSLKNVKWRLHWSTNFFRFVFFQGVKFHLSTQQRAQRCDGCKRNLVKPPKMLMVIMLFSRKNKALVIPFFLNFSASSNIQINFYKFFILRSRDKLK